MEEEKEIWKSIFGYEGYYDVSNFGNIKTIPRNVVSAISKTGYRTISEKIHMPCDNGKGYKYVCFRIDGNKKKHRYIHIMVAECFLEKKEGDVEVNHKDGDKANNHHSNLEWCTKSYNACHARDTGLKVCKKGEDVSQSKLKSEDVLFIRSEFEKGNFTMSQLSKKFNVNHGCIWKIIKRHKWKHI